MLSSLANAVGDIWESTVNMCKDPMIKDGDERELITTDEAQADFEGSFQRKGAWLTHTTYGELREDVLTIYDEHAEGERDLIETASLAGRYSVSRITPYSWRLMGRNGATEFNFEWVIEDETAADAWCHALKNACIMVPRET